MARKLTLEAATEAALADTALMDAGRALALAMQPILTHWRQATPEMRAARDTASEAYLAKLEPYLVLTAKKHHWDMKSHIDFTCGMF